MQEAVKEADAARQQTAKLQVTPPGRPKAEHAPSGGSDPRSGGAWGLTFSYDMLGEGARTDADALRYLKSYADAIEFIAGRAHSTGALEQNDGMRMRKAPG
jgi:hypothetical protein